MKFTDGFWRSREGLKIYNAYKVHDYVREKNSITAYLPHSDIQNRGQTLEGPVITLRLSSPAPEVIRVQAWHFEGKNKSSPVFLDHLNDKDVLIEEKKEYISLSSGALTAKLNLLDSWNLEFQDADKKLCNSRGKNLGYVRMDDGKTYMKEQLSLSVGELVYGLGEYFTPFVKNGQVIETWNADGGTASELSYKSIPFYMTNRGYGVFVNDPKNVAFEIGSEKVCRVQFSVAGEYLDYFIINGPDPKQILDRYTALTGRPNLPPAWSFGLWLTTSFTTDYDEKTVSSFIDGMAERDIPLHVFHFDCFWMREYHWTNFEWDKRWFPDPRGFLARIKKKGLKVCAWINPYIAQRSALFNEGKEKGYLLKKTDGSVYQVDTWQPGMGFVDFTNPEACRWYQSYLVKLLDDGVDCFKTDFGERIPTDDTLWFDGSDPEAMHNYYSFLYNKTVYELLQKKRGKNDAVVFARSATAGGQQFPVHWGGDCTASFESMAESMRGGLSLGMTGFGYWSHDISGFELTAPASLYKRWSAYGLLSSHSRLHGNSSYRVPWLFDEESVDVLRFFTKLKCRLMPYLFAAAVEAQKGIPMARAMFLEFPTDPACSYLDRQYMLGGNLLVAPVFSDHGRTDFFLPEGQWTNFFTGERIEGGKWRQETHSYMSLPLYVRQNSFIAIGMNEADVDYDYADNVELRLYGLQEGKIAECEVFNPQGVPELIVKASKNNGKIVIEVLKAQKDWHLRLVGMAHVKECQLTVAVDGVDALISIAKGIKKIDISF